MAISTCEVLSTLTWPVYSIKAKLPTASLKEDIGFSTSPPKVTERLIRGEASRLCGPMTDPAK